MRLLWVPPSNVVCTCIDGIPTANYGQRTKVMIGQTEAVERSVEGRLANWYNMTRARSSPSNNSCLIAHL